MADAVQISTSVSIINSLLGFQAISLTNFTTSALSNIAAGSKCEIGSAFFNFSSECTPNASSWTAITTATTAYLALTPSGTAGSQIVSASWTATVPVWSTSKQGYYASAASAVRVVGSVYKNSATQQSNKKIFQQDQMQAPHGCEVFTTSGSFIVPIGVNTIYITGCAAGGNGASYLLSSNYGGGGGGGEWAIKKSFSVTPGSILTVTIGAVSSNTSIGTFELNHGENASASTGGAGGALSMGTGAGGAGGDTAKNGVSAFSPGGSGRLAGGGGGSYGGGGVGFHTSVLPSNGGYGGGGGGVTELNTPGSGGPAILIVEW